MFTGALILNLFGACWWIAGLLWEQAPIWLVSLPVLVCAGLTALAWRASRHAPARTPTEEKRAGRLIGVWSAAEGVGFFLAINVLRNMHREVDIAPVLAAIVGLHFYPLARGLPVPVYYVSATALLAIALAAFLVPPAYRPAATCFASGLVLWVTSAVRSAQASAASPRGREASL